MPDKSTALCVFSPSGKRGRFPVGTRVLQAARELGVDIDSICGGRARCGRCQVEAVEGSFAKEQIVSSPRHLTEMGEAEQYCLQRGRLDDGNRLSCQAKILGDVRIDVPASSQVHHQVVRKDYEAHDIKLDPVVHLYFVEVGQADMHTPEGDLQRLMRALKEEWGLTGLSCDLVMLQQLQDALREGKWQVTVAIRYGNQIVAVWPGFRDQVFGAAIDVGSTTIAVHLCDLISGEVRASSGAMNPQIR
ncbi:MAG: 2Fe-2S iron-sulfur cluster-binding protein, partial [Xanthomonadales bacterium]|nr:2Fe-2S iron-sulfur cluster-binding protein [Xanthomonadales bacterium]